MVEFERALVSFFVGAAEMLGVPKSVAAIYGTCFASPEPLSFSEIQERLDISAGSISQGLRVLRDMGALKVVTAPSVDSAPPSLRSVPSSAVRFPSLPSLPRLTTSSASSTLRRRDRFEPDLELRNLVGRFLEQRLEKQLKAGKRSLRAITKSVPASENGSAKVLKARLKALQTWHDKASSVLPVIKSFLKLT